MGPTPPAWSLMSEWPFAVGGRLAAPSVYIPVEPRGVGAPVSALAEGRHEAHKR
jgi:hypothetical protein